jgi:HD superfamily phosphodiesterase
MIPGAVVGFNGIYKDFREDQELKDSYTITLFVAFVTSLSLSCEFEDDSVMVKTTKLSISHLERILIKKKDSFNIVSLFL